MKNYTNAVYFKERRGEERVSLFVCSSWKNIRLNGRVFNEYWMERVQKGNVSLNLIW